MIPTSILIYLFFFVRLEAFLSLIFGDWPSVESQNIKRRPETTVKIDVKKSKEMTR